MTTYLEGYDLNSLLIRFGEIEGAVWPSEKIIITADYLAPFYKPGSNYIDEGDPLTIIRLAEDEGGMSETVSNFNTFIASDIEDK